MIVLHKKTSLKPQYPCVNMGGGLNKKIKPLNKSVSQKMRKVTVKISTSAVLNKSGFRCMFGYLSGIMSGILFIKGLEIFLNRKGLPGGEVLIIPLIVMLFALGVDVGKEYGCRRGRDKGYYEGFEDGYFEASGTCKEGTGGFNAR